MRRARVRCAALRPPEPASASRAPPCQGPSRPRGPGARHHNVAVAPLARGHDHREDAGHGPEATGQGQLADEHDLVQRPCRHHSGRPEHRDRDGQVVVGAALGQIGRREQDRRASRGGPLEPAVDDGHPAAVPRFVERGIGPSDQHGGDLARRHVGLDVDQVARSTVEGDRVAGGEGHQASPLTCSTTAAPRRGRRTATRSTLASSGWTSCSSAHRHTSRCNRSSLASSTAS